MIYWSLIILVVLSIQRSTEQFTVFENEVLTSHNSFRAKHGCQPLILNATLSAVAQDWANNLAQLDVMKHHENGKYGENLYSLWNSAKATANATAIVSAWYNEIIYFNFTANKFIHAAGHFSQVVWNSSQQLGVGYAYNNPRKLYVVCEYNPPGNYAGLYTSNVPRPLT